MMRLEIAPCSLADAQAFVVRVHRHHGRVAGHKFSLAVLDGEGQVRGVAIVGRPVARMLDDGLTLEVTRVATDGAMNACSALYGAARRAAFALGYRKILTYILETEPGTTLRAVGWQDCGPGGGGSWSRPSRPAIDKHPLCPKRRWESSAA